MVRDRPRTEVSNWRERESIARGINPYNNEYYEGMASDWSPRLCGREPIHVEQNPTHYDTTTVREIALTALTGFSQVSSRQKNVGYYRGRIAEIEKAGFEVPEYRGLTRKQTRAVYGEVLNGVRALVRKVCPEVFIEIEQINDSEQDRRELMR